LHETLRSDVGNCFWIVSRFLLDNGVNEARIHPCPFTRAKDNPIEIAISGQGNIPGYRLYLLGGYDGRECGTENEAGEIENKEEGNDGKRCEPRRAQMQILKTIC
jgi:hypothetical protein